MRDDTPVTDLLTLWTRARAYHQDDLATTYAASVLDFLRAGDEWPATSIQRGRFLTWCRGRDLVAPHELECL